MRDEIFIPFNLTCLPNELSWQQIAGGRIKHGLNEFSLKLKHTDNFGIDTDLCGNIK